MFVYIYLLVCVCVSARTLMEKLAWPAGTFVHVECNPGENFKTCYTNCMTWGPNQTVEFLQRNCYTKVPANTHMRISRIRTYRSLANTTYAKTESWLPGSRDTWKTGITLDFSADRPYIDRPDIVKQVLIREVNLHFANHQLMPFNIFWLDGHEIPRRADGQFSHEENNGDYRTQCYLTTPEFPWVEKQKYDNENLDIPFINITEAAINLDRDFPPVILLYGTFVIYGDDRRRDYHKHLQFNIEITEEQNIVTDPNCIQIKNCEECMKAHGCDWCLMTNSTYACMDTCQIPWAVNECRPVRKTRLSLSQ